MLLIGGHRCRNDIIPDLFVVPGLFTGSALFFSPQTKLTQKSGCILFKLANPCRYKNNLKHIVATLKFYFTKSLEEDGQQDCGICNMAVVIECSRQGSFFFNV